MKLLIVIPCLNEERHLPALLDWLCADGLSTTARIVVADGGSTDRSCEIVAARAATDPRVILLPNPKRLQGAGVNLAFAQFGADADIMIRVDAHADYPKDFLFRLLAAQRQTGADSVAISMRAVARKGACFQRAAATAQNSVLGAGGSPHRKGGVRRWVEHGHHALFTAAAFKRVGGYDESFSHNEDAELDARLIQQGGRILLAADILIDYYPRATPAALARQYFNYGAGRARTFRKHRMPLKPRQILPILIAPAAALAVLAPLYWVFAAPAFVWLIACLGFGALLSLRERNVCAAFSGVAAAIMHLAWSLGFLRGLSR
jgi:succinoglycan biosynthesis protein ExoA